MVKRRDARIGTAGWSVPRAAGEAFPASGTQLQRYAARFSCAEINTSFYRPHRPQTYARWRASVPEDFRFAVKAPRKVTHEARLKPTKAELDRFVDEIAHLGPSLGPVLVQLPPSLAFDAPRAGDFLDDLRERFAGEIVLEPRHRSWFDDAAEDLLRARRVVRVAADPAICPQAAIHGGWEGLRYWRLHGSPRMYCTPYGKARLRNFAAHLRPGDWCVLDNTAQGAAVADALALQELVESGGGAMWPGAALK